MTNADKFKQIFGLYATELWSKTEGEFLVWLNSDFNQSDVLDTNVDDIISRQAAIETIWRVVEQDNAYEMKKAIINEVKDYVPSAQPEIIRCKDCKHWDMSWENDNIPNHHYCPLSDGMHRGDFYCADAERRGEQDEVLR